MRKRRRLKLNIHNIAAGFSSISTLLSMLGGRWSVAQMGTKADVSHD